LIRRTSEWREDAFAANAPGQFLKPFLVKHLVRIRTSDSINSTIGMFKYLSMISLLLSRSTVFLPCESSSFLKLIGQKNLCVFGLVRNNSQVFACGRSARCSGFGRVALVGFEFQLAHRAVASRYIACESCRNTSLDELSIGSGWQ
jgi:hypothetical protein